MSYSLWPLGTFQSSWFFVNIFQASSHNIFVNAEYSIFKIKDVNNVDARYIWDLMSILKCPIMPDFFNF